MAALTAAEPALREARILIIDDEESNLLVLEHILEEDGYLNVTSTSDSAAAVALCAAAEPDLVVLDLDMPPPDGFEVMRQLRPQLARRWTPVLVLTGDTSAQARHLALSKGAKDFLSKPPDAVEVLLRIRNLLEAHFLQRALLARNETLERRVDERTRDRDEARVDTLERLAVVAEYRDDTTGQHTRRVGRISVMLARQLGLPEAGIETIGQAAPLHDVGKIAIPDRILRKPGTLTATEFGEMKGHARIGGFILSGSSSPVLQAGETIALTHHERWDGQGYPAGLCDEQIPLAGRIVALADAFDAMACDRPYKRAWPAERVHEEIHANRGRQFDPDVVDAFEAVERLRPLGAAVSLSRAEAGATATA